MGSAARSGIGVAILVRIGKSPRLALRTKLGPLSSWPTCVPTSLIVAGCSSLSGPIMCWLRRVLCRITISSHRPCRAPTASSSSSARPRRLRPRVGDLHGCFRTLDRALSAIGFDPSADRLFGVGGSCQPRAALGGGARLARAVFRGRRAGRPRSLRAELVRREARHCAAGRVAVAARYLSARHQRARCVPRTLERRRPRSSRGACAVAAFTGQGRRRDPHAARRTHPSSVGVCSALPPPGPARGLERPPVEGPPQVGPEAHRVGQCPVGKAS